MKLAIGQRVIVTRPDEDPPTAAGIIIEGPMLRAAGVMFKVWIGGGDGCAAWIGEDRIALADRPASGG